MKRLSRVVLFTSFLMAAAPVAASTLSDDAASGFTGSEFGWLLHQDLLTAPEAEEGEPGALALVAQAMRENDPQAGLGLQNYLKRYPNDPAAYDLAGTHLLIVGKNREAVVSLGQALKLNPSAHWTRAKYGAALMLLDQTFAARKQLNRVLDKDSDNALALRWLQRMALQDDDLPAAIRYAQRSLAAFGMPRSTFNQAHLALADLYISAGRWNDAFDLLSPVLGAPRLEVPDQFAISLLGRLVQISTEVDNAEAARQALDRAAARLPGDSYQYPPWAILEARTLTMEGRPDEALAILERLSSNPQAARALVAERAMTAVAAEKGGAALKDIADTIANDPAGETVGLMLLYRSVGDATGWPSGALATLKGALPAKPAADIEVALAQAEISAGQPAMARERALGVIKGAGPDLPTPVHVSALQLLAALDLMNEDKPAAVKRLRIALDLDPTNEQLWLTLAAYTHDSGGHAHASANEPGHGELRSILLEATEAVPNSTTIWGELGIVDFTAGDTESATQMFLKALELAPSRPEINLLAALALADSGGDLDKAEALAKFALDLDPKNANARDTFGWVTFKKDGAAEDALAHFELALAAAPHDATTLRHKAEVLTKLGREDEAADAVMIALAGELAAHDRAAARDILLKTRPLQRIEAPIARVTPDGAGDVIGTAIFESIADGSIKLSLSANGLPVGLNPIHIHDLPTCAPSTDGSLGGAAGAHYGMDGMDHGMHQTGDDAAEDDGGDMSATAEQDDDAATLPKGDLPSIEVGDGGALETVIDIDWLQLDEVRGRSLMIHDGTVEGHTKFACVIIG